MESKTPLSHLIALLREKKLDALIVDHDDPHASEIPHETYDRLSFISGFTGSSGCALITTSKSYLWTDSRYFIQAEKELSSPWILMKLREKGVPLIHDFILQNPDLKKIGFDLYTTSYNTHKFWKEKLHDRELVGLTANPIDEIWSDKRPQFPLHSVKVHELRYSGLSVTDKMLKFREEMLKRGSDAIVLTLLDEIAYALNLRGSDSDVSPFFYSYLVIEKEAITLFIESKKVDDLIIKYLNSHKVSVRGYNEIFKYLENLGVTSDTDTTTTYKIWVSPSVSVYICNSFLQSNSEVLKRELIVENTPICNIKVDRPINILIIIQARKNDTELQGMAEAHILDGIALARFFGDVLNKKEDGTLFKETEFTLGELSTRYRLDEDECVGYSFPPISAIGSNGAIVHYRPDKENSSLIEPKMYLLDSGGQFYGGTTDVTRTVHFGDPTPEEKEAYTLVLKGHLALRQAIFPENTSGLSLDVLARQYLWKTGRNYYHGTGHGVGAFLNVHEGPASISTLSKTATGRLSVVYLEEGMVLSNEPGYYKEGEFGIRIENVVYVKPLGDDFSEDSRKYFTFDDFTLVPYCKELLDHSILTKEEKEWINEYHKRIADTLIPRMLERSSHEYESAIEYIKKSAEPI
ncbi:peptidase, putative [Theileria equi strain WA]|uniref:Peptidase, putative n=1 Tax=Theileria equi strain WA TaxID=1537102 RepID=L0B2Y0_THEEQ|nr:peptidase, putative [Theileria equi strain WA]AFZ81581.1 peptidase, putative [Theileria equi strain WA]|eukprot:XP_004831247.1 peptidase, putative [Theileria equi strain WA]